MKSPSYEWRRLGVVDPARLLDARLQLHHAAQALAAFGQAMIEPRKDDSHRSMTWELGRGCLRSEASDGGVSVRLYPEPFSLEVDRHGETLGAPDLRGRRPSEVLLSLGDLLASAGEERGAELRWPEYDLPTLPAGDDTPLDPDPVALAELGSWLANAASILSATFGSLEEASTIRCWPHHFDIATLLTFPAADDSGDAAHVGAGLSPGDGARPSPYYYVNGWPPPAAEDLPTLTGPGSWNTEGWIGAVLDAHEIVAHSSAEEQEQMVGRFLAAASAAMRSVVLDSGQE